MDQQLGMELQEMPASANYPETDPVSVHAPTLIFLQKTPDEPDFDEILRIHECERQRMGRELHDTAGQLLTSLELSIAVLRETGGGHDRLIDEIHDMVRKVSLEIRTLAFLDYPAQIAEGGLCGALRSLSRGLGNRTGLRILVRCASDLPEIGERLSLPLLRVAQEALTNVHRHARATEAKIILRKRGNAIELVVSDNGRGLPVNWAQLDSNGVGLRGMRHRVESIDGRLRITNLKQGMRVCACVPFPA